MYERFVVDLENNHHYVLIDIITGYQYYTPAQDDANAICGMLNSQYERMDKQRQEIQKLKQKLLGAGISVDTEEKYCNNCANCDFVSLNYDGKDVWCNVKDKSVYQYDYCQLWKGKE